MHVAPSTTRRTKAVCCTTDLTLYRLDPVGYRSEQINTLRLDPVGLVSR